MSFRGTQIYVQWSTVKMLKLIAKTRPTETTADEIADTALRAWVAAEYPKVSLLLEEQDRLEKEFLAEAPAS